jgi:aminopeptidase
MYQPEQDILEKYADVLVNFALNGGSGIETGDVVRVTCPEVAKPLYAELRKAVLDAGGHLIGSYRPNAEKGLNLSRDFYKHASEDQLTYFPSEYYRGLVDAIDHSIAIQGKTNKQALKDVDSDKIMQRSQAFKPYMDWRNEKEHNGEFSWTLALYGTEAAANEADINLESYWQEIISACYLDTDNPISEWSSMQSQIHKIKEKLDKLPIKTITVESENTDITIKLGDKRQWRGGSGNNIPSYEIFTSPDWRGTEGVFQATQPLYRYGNLITGITLVFEDGEVIQASANKNEDVLKDMIEAENAERIGEFSLTDKRFSRISKFMAETLFDENVGAEHGNTHIALGRAYKDCFDGDPSEPSEDEWDELGFNDSAVHTDIVSTEPRTATAKLEDGSEKVIYKNGKYQV